jgi:hypothetical protein
MTLSRFVCVCKSSYLIYMNALVIVWLNCVFLCVLAVCVCVYVPHQINEFFSSFRFHQFEPLNEIHWLLLHSLFHYTNTHSRIMPTLTQLLMWMYVVLMWMQVTSNSTSSLFCRHSPTITHNFIQFNTHTVNTNAREGI